MPETEIHFYHLENLLKVVEALVKEKYKFTIEVNDNGTYSIALDKEQDVHSKIF